MVNYTVLLHCNVCALRLELHVELKGKHSRKGRQSPQCDHCVSHLLCVYVLYSLDLYRTFRKSVFLLSIYPSSDTKREKSNPQKNSNFQSEDLLNTIQMLFPGTKPLEPQ